MKNVELTKTRICCGRPMNPKRDRRGPWPGTVICYCRDCGKSAYVYERDLPPPRASKEVRLAALTKASADLTHCGKRMRTRSYIKCPQEPGAYLVTCVVCHKQQYATNVLRPSVKLDASPSDGYFKIRPLPERDNLCFKCTLLPDACDSNHPDCAWDNYILLKKED